MNNKVSFCLFCSLNELFHVKIGRRLLPASFLTQAESGVASASLQSKQALACERRSLALHFEHGDSYHFDDLRNRSSHQRVHV